MSKDLKVGLEEKVYEELYDLAVKLKMTLKDTASTVVSIGLADLRATFHAESNL